MIIAGDKEKNMDTRTGEVRSLEDWNVDFKKAAEKVSEINRGLKESMNKAEKAVKKYMVTVDEANLSIRKRRELLRTGKTVVGPRARCPCGSGHRFKRCCMGKAAAEIGIKK